MLRPGWAAARQDLARAASGNAQWLGRSGDQACGPTTFAYAKAAAIAMSAGACGDYTIERPIAHLNGLQARIEDAA
jgi:hypothetical protein